MWTAWWTPDVSAHLPLKRTWWWAKENAHTIAANVWGAAGSGTTTTADRTSFQAWFALAPPTRATENALEVRTAVVSLFVAAARVLFLTLGVSEREVDHQQEEQCKVEILLERRKLGQETGVSRCSSREGLSAINCYRAHIMLSLPPHFVFALTYLKPFEPTNIIIIQNRSVLGLLAI
jgi:hypothetical protein